ncbi:uncharacterized protein PGTG_18013 [Puccinia graminis f. sp. tritici CRL 75-36-700-3]|uniref:Uncharacterized protein n=1 Tax=Puccinia graminis f. sp. tritici (strain CRL 75-36-700-3 / race SCCL) TaxID=418459 RepID=E3L714_PUCGT|nr:uncharacterized protein PGTG_18013 [Puccinia graminis f. sp. tritici CRL 75-36-700-3]EFP92339.1 hypothetical protein PGTG_18013 [Puccinia graminis f. sp. tritici CRL 75-36-700-3]
MVTSCREVANGASDSGSELEVIVAHCDWDGEERVHRRFNVKYIVPGTKNLVKTHTLYQAGRKVNIIGRLVDFDVKDHMAVVLVSSVSITSGHQLGRTITVNQGPSTSSPIAGRKFTSFSSKKKDSPRTSPAVDRLKSTLPNTKAPIGEHDTNKAAKPAQPRTLDKGKAKACDNSDSDQTDASEDDSGSESAAEVAATPSPQAKRGRPRKSIIQEAAKRMKKH